MGTSKKKKITAETLPNKYFIRQIVGLSCICLAFVILLVIRYFFKQESETRDYLAFVKAITFFAGLGLAIPYEWIPYVFFDNREYDKNEEVPDLVEKIRFRAVLFNNISILVFLFTIGVIITGFVLLTSTNNAEEISNITVKISTSVLLIFLVQMMFKLFKYLLRVAAFYNGKADALEFSKMKPDIPLEKIIDFFTPEKYDITDMESTISGNFIEILKAKLGMK
jgi:hypothetical protein